MKKISSVLLSLLLFVLLLITSCGKSGCRHKDNDNNGVCDKCFSSVFVYYDLYSLSGLAKSDADVDRITDYVNAVRKENADAVFLSSGNMLRVGEESKIQRWMNKASFSAMGLGALDFERGAEFIGDFSENADFPLICINLFDEKTGKRAEFTQPSASIEIDGFKIGVIGAIYNPETQITSDKFEGYFFKGGKDLNKLVSDEAEKLRKNGADLVVYVLQGGYENSVTDSVQNVSFAEIPYYDSSLSSGLVDLVLENYGDASYRLLDEGGVYHVQNSQGSAGVSYIEIAYNSAKNKTAIRTTRLITSDEVQDIEIPGTDQNQGSNASEIVGNSSLVNSQGSDSSTISKPAAPEAPSNSKCDHKDANADDICDVCKFSVIVELDFFSVNDLHGKFDDVDGQEGVDELTTYLKNAKKENSNSIFVSAGDMWQGSSESNMTKGQLMTDWMNELGFSGMALGNHEFDWGTEYIEKNSDFASFPILAINVYDRKTNKRVEYCDASTLVDKGSVQIGIIGAVGDCYSSIAADKCEDVYFKTGSQLTSLVKEESEKLKKQGADFIVYLLHDGLGSGSGDYIRDMSSSSLSSYYDGSLSNGYVDLVFEGHTHQGYILKDSGGVIHIQNKGDNKGGISHVEIMINSVSGKYSLSKADLVSVYEYSSLADDPIVDELLEKYKDVISGAYEILGQNASYRSSDFLCQLAADLYYEAGIKKWGDKYDIALGGGFLSLRSPYNLPAGEVKYSDLYSILPFDNPLILCKISGRDLKNKFFNTSNDRYYISYGSYGESVKNNIDLNGTYYVVVDSYTSQYKQNGLTEVARYDETTFARDLMADYIRKGGLK